MKNYYEILGVKKDATKTAIRKAYRGLANIQHPDKGGDAEKFKEIVEAYETLSDTDKRKSYDEDWEVYNDDASHPIAGYLKTTEPPYSKRYRDQHARYAAEFLKKPLKRKFTQSLLKFFESSIYEYQGKRDTEKKIFHDIYSFLEQKEFDHPNYNPKVEVIKSLSPEFAVLMLIEFLQGKFYGEELKYKIVNFSVLLGKLRSQDIPPKDLLFYESILEIISYKKFKDSEKLLLAIKNIADFAKLNIDVSINYLANLFQNKYYRNLIAYTLHLYWQNDSEKITFLEKFDGRAEIEKLIQEMKEKLSSARSSDTYDKAISLYIRHMKMLLNLEKAIQEKITNKKNLSEAYRNKAYDLLDWVPALSITTKKSILLNTLMQIGRYFQKAAQYEIRSYKAMADEKLAIELYMSAISSLEHDTPNLQAYFLIHTIKYTTKLKFEHDHVVKSIQDLQHLVLVIVNIFPFMQLEQSNIVFLKENNEPVFLMRALLQALLNLIDSNEKKKEKNETDLFSIDHKYVTVFYQIYEACLENWYNDNYDLEFEKLMRLRLMQELLAVNRWTFFDLDLNLDSPWVMVDRDDSGWMRPSRSLPFSSTTKDQNYIAIDGVEFNQKTGTLSFALRSWQKNNDLEYDRLLTLNDIAELFETKLTGAFFSLDPIDPDMQYHPFNAMRFSPDILCKTQLFHSMLLTDYLLKFFTTGKEVQGRHPYDMRQLDELTKNLPAYLKLIITDYQNSSSEAKLHRFWIEAEEVEVAQEENNGVIKYAFDDINMIVKKHKMKRGIDGNIVDISDEDEGWDFYTLPLARKLSIEQGKYNISSPAIVFINNTKNFFFYEEGKFSQIYTFKRLVHLLENLAEESHDENYKVIKNAKNKRLFYRITREIARQTGKSHRYSPEYIFAQEFTIHYNEFAQYFPEFGRLRELSKAVALIRIMDSRRKANNDAIKELNNRLHATEINKLFHERKPEVEKNIKNYFSKLREKVSKNVISREQAKILDNLKNEIDSKLKEINGYSSEYSKIREIFKNQLKENFNDYFTNVFDLHNAIGEFLSGNKSSLLNAMVEFNQRKIYTSIQENFPTHSILTIGDAINGSITSINAIITEKVNSELEEYKQSVNEKMNELKRLQTSFMKLGLSDNEEKINLENVCLWVPASIKHDRNESRSRIVYGGVSVYPQLSFIASNSQQGQALLNQTFNGPSQVIMNGSQFPTSGGGGSSSNSGGYGGGSSSSGGGNGGDNNGNNRFVMLANNVTKQEARNLLKSNEMNLPFSQVNKLLYSLGSGRMDNVSIKVMNNGEVRLAAERPGAVDGYQRMSFGIDRDGRTRLVQTAFDDKDNLVHQKPGQSKNNLYDVKKWR